MVGEAAGGYVAHPLALLATRATCWRMWAPSIALLWRARAPARDTRALLRLLRAEILAALVNGAVLIVIAVGIGVEAWHRFAAPPTVRAGLMVGSRASDSP